MSYYNSIKSSKKLVYDSMFDINSKDERQSTLSGIMPDNVRFFIEDRGTKDEHSYYFYELYLEEFSFFKKHSEITMNRLIDQIMKLVHDNVCEGQELIIETHWNYLFDTDNFVYIDGTYDELSPELLRSFFQMEDFDHKKLTIRY